MTVTARVPTLEENGWVAVATSWSVWMYATITMLAFYFVYRYARYSPWRETAVGRGLMTLSTAICAVLVNTLLAVLLGPEWLLRDVARLLTLGYSIGGLAYMVRNLVQLQGGWRQRNRSPTTPPATQTPENAP